MTHLYDRQSPRDLTIPELWASWDIMIDQPSQEAKMVQGTLGRDTLPSFALNDENIPSRTLKELWELFHETDREKREFPKKLACVKAVKDHANELYKQDDWLEALAHYKNAWCTLLPYHLDAFPAGHPAKSLIAKMECKIFSNIMATVLKMVKANDHKYSKQRKSKLLDIGYRSGMAILGICFAMDVDSLQTTLKIDVLDTYKTCQAPRKEFRKLHDGLIKYCKDRDPDEQLFHFDYKAPPTKSDFKTIMTMAMMKFMDM
ncbi:uncharacterized protein L199_006841 [Kwoniella botswanensis]|uniref:uncharacterized protein n=1 Tax=Kwoniella botswanensis TaxID=1268659 RepID=UPI00315C6786